MFKLRWVFGFIFCQFTYFHAFWNVFVMGIVMPIVCEEKIHHRMFILYKSQKSFFKSDQSFNNLAKYLDTKIDRSLYFIIDFLAQDARTAPLARASVC